MIETLQNKQVRKLLVSILLIVSCGFLLTLWLPWYIGLFLSLILICYVVLRFESQRRRELISLTMYLKRLNHNDYNYELINFDEGDMSLLKSEVHKTMYLLKNNNLEMERQKKFIYDSLSDISHQLKTPITGIQLMLDLIGEDNEHMDHMGVQVNRLESLVQGLLTHIQLEAQSISMQKEAILSDVLIEKLMDMVHTDLKISLDVESFEMYIDVKWSLEALFNVLNNKLRHANKSITLKVSKNKLYHVIEISDDGEAIDMVERKLLFDRFYKGKQSSSESIGIGLAITKEIMELQNGKVIIVDENTFKFLFES